MNTNPSTRSCFPFVVHCDDVFEMMFATVTYAWTKTSCSSWIYAIENCSDCRGCCDKQTIARETEEESIKERAKKRDRLQIIEAVVLAVFTNRHR